MISPKSSLSARATSPFEAIAKNPAQTYCENKALKGLVALLGSSGIIVAK
ncbi:MAG: hypothetical protein LW850_21755 [Planctomycetaceae bacterium]|jgi:hypothetical protein|nr:hypothetical protein [Planctomycetaceae bacterium]